jgi:hypothetical protein
VNYRRKKRKWQRIRCKLILKLSIISIVPAIQRKKGELGNLRWFFVESKVHGRGICFTDLWKKQVVLKPSSPSAALRIIVVSWLLWSMEVVVGEDLLSYQKEEYI